MRVRHRMDGTKPSRNSHEVDPQVNRIYERLAATFRNPSTANELDRALKCMELIAPLSREDVSQKSYSLFHTVMQAPVSLAYTQEKKWEASRLAMHGAYKWDQFMPRVVDPLDVLAFLDHHFDLATEGGQSQDEPIQNALRALTYASDSVIIDHLKRFDPTKPSFVRGICYIYRDNYRDTKPFKLRKAATFFLPLISDRFFNTPSPIMERDEMRTLCVGWASAVDAIKDSCDVQEATLAVLFDMINSPHWRPHIVPEKWDLLKFPIPVPDDFQPLRRCIDNPELIEAIRMVADPDVIARWLKILWLKYPELIPEVRARLETATWGISHSRRRADLDWYLAAITSQLEELEGELAQYDNNTRLADPTAAALRAKIADLRKAEAALTTIKMG